MSPNLTDRLGVRLDPDVRRRLEAQALAEERKPGGLVRRLISEGCAGEVAATAGR
jgi:hypothetical protein